MFKISKLLIKMKKSCHNSIKHEIFSLFHKLNKNHDFLIITNMIAHLKRGKIISTTIHQ